MKIISTVIKSSLLILFTASHLMAAQQKSIKTNGFNNLEAMPKAALNGIKGLNATTIAVLGIDYVYKNCKNEHFGALGSAMQTCQKIGTNSQFAPACEEATSFEYVKKIANCLKQVTLSFKEE